MSTLDEFDAGVPEAESLYDPHLNAQYDSGARKLNDARRRLIEETELTPAEKRVLYKFDIELRNLNNRENRHKKVTRALHVNLTRILQANSGLLIDILDESHDGKEALDELLEWLQSQDFSGNYIHNQMITIQVFGEVLGSEIVYDRVDELQPGSFRESGSAPLPGNVVEWTEAIEMAGVRTNVRDKAMYLVDWGSGARPEEFHMLQYKHLKWEDGHYGLTIPETGKTGSRTLKLFPGAAILRRWIQEEHPVHADPEAELGPETYIWTELNSNTLIEYNTVYKNFKEAGELAGIAKPTNPQHFRRSRASFKAGKPTISEEELRNDFGWGYNTSAPTHYITRFRQDLDRNSARADGADIDVFEKQQKVAPIECNACNQWTERHMEHCVRCGAEVDADRHEAPTSATVANGETDLVSMIVDGEVGPDDLRSVKKLWGVIQTRPRLGEQIDSLIKMAKGAAEDEKTNAFGGLGALAGWAIGIGVDAGHRAAAAWAKAKHRAMSLDPDYQHYPPTRDRTGAIGIGLVIYLFGVVGYMQQMGMLQSLRAGETTSQIALVLGLGLGAVMVARALPDLDEVEP